MSKSTIKQSSLPVEIEDAGMPARAKFSYAVMLAGLVILAATGIGSFVTNNVPMTGWVLMAHVGAAPLFAVGLALVALTWAGQEQSCFARLMFWLVLLSGLVVILSGVVPMTPLFGTDGQHTLYLVHRYSAFVLTAAVVLHLVSSRKGSCAKCR